VSHIIKSRTIVTIGNLLCSTTCDRKLRVSRPHTCCAALHVYLGRILSSTTCVRKKTGIPISGNNMLPVINSYRILIVPRHFTFQSQSVIIRIYSPKMVCFINVYELVQYTAEKKKVY
jgi:hypothetical protein